MGSHAIPMALSSCGRYEVVKRGDYYAIKGVKTKLENVHKWQGEEILHSALMKRGFTKVTNKSAQLVIDLEKAGKKHLPDGAERFTYKPTKEYGTIYIPVNRLRQVYQSDEALNPKKVKENMEKMKAGVPLAPVQIGYNYDVHDGHHRWEAAKKLGYSHVPVEVVGTDADKLAEAKAMYRDVWKSSVALVLDITKSLPNGGGTVGGRQLNKGKLVKRQVVVKRANGKTFTRMQWVDPNDKNPNIMRGAGDKDEATYQHHTTQSKELERRLSNKFPVVHPDIKDLHNNGQVDKKLVEEAKNSYHRGEKLPPIKMNDKHEVVEGHHLVEMAKELGLSHVPAYVMGNTSRKKAIEDTMKEHTMVHDEQSGTSEPAFVANPSDRVNITSEFATDVNKFKNITTKKYTKSHLMAEARRQGITWNELSGDGKLDDSSPIMWMRAHTAIAKHIASGEHFEVRHIEKNVDDRMKEDGWDSIQKHFLKLLEKHGSKQNLMDWASKNDIWWKPTDDPSVAWMRAATAIKKELAKGKMVDGIRTRQKGAMEKANLVITPQHREMVKTLGARYGKKRVMDRARSLGITWRDDDKEGNILGDNSPVLWMRASSAIQEYIAKGNSFAIDDEHDPTNGMTAVVGDYGNGKLTRLQALAVDLGKRNSQNFEPDAKEWGLKAIQVDNPNMTPEEASAQYDKFVENARNSRIMVHFDPLELIDHNGTTLLDQLSADGRLKNEFELGRFKSWQEARESEERELFGDDFTSDATDSERPIYGTMDLLNNGLKGNRAGSVAFVLKDDAKKRATGLYTDSAEIWGQDGKLTRSLEDPHHLLVDRWKTKWAKPKNTDKVRQRSMNAVMTGTAEPDDKYFEAHIHGGVQFDRDIDHVLVPSHWLEDEDKYSALEKLMHFSETFKVPLKYE